MSASSQKRTLASRLYEQERRTASAVSPLEMYVRRWLRWTRSGGIAPNKISALSRIGAAPKARITIGGGIPLGELVIAPSVVEPLQTGDRHRHHGKAHPYFTAP